VWLDHRASFLERHVHQRPVGGDDQHDHEQLDVAARRTRTSAGKWP
jgi:hypothetical protein